MSSVIFSLISFGFNEGSVKRTLCSDGSTLSSLEKQYSQIFSIVSHYEIYSDSIGYESFKNPYAYLASFPIYSFLNKILIASFFGYPIIDGNLIDG